jgi:hypothetical protein
MGVVFITSSSSCKQITSGDFNFTFNSNQTIPSLVQCIQRNQTVVCNEIYLSDPPLNIILIVIICFILPTLFGIGWIFHNRKKIKVCCDNLC